MHFRRHKDAATFQYFNLKDRTVILTAAANVFTAIFVHKTEHTAQSTKCSGQETFGFV